MKRGSRRAIRSHSRVVARFERENVELLAISVDSKFVQKQFADHEGHLGMVDDVLETLLHRVPRPTR